MYTFIIIIIIINAQDNSDLLHDDDAYLGIEHAGQADE